MALCKDTTQNATLAELFDSVDRTMREAESCTDRVEKLGLQRQALQLIDTALDRVYAAGLFSSNEEVDDIPTPNLKYLLLNSFKAQLLSGFVTDGPEQRQLALQATRRAASAFLELLMQYKMLGGPAAAAAEEWVEQGQDSGPKSDPGTTRQRKIEFFKRRRQLAGLLGRQPDEDGDEAELRPAWMAQLESAALQRLDELPAVQQELELLRHAAAADPEQLAKQRADRDAANADILHSLRGTLQALQRGRRDQIRAGVFKPSHELPSMTVEQFGMLEAQAAAERAQREQRVQDKEQRRLAELRSDDEEEDDRNKQKQEDPELWGAGSADAAFDLAMATPPSIKEVLMGSGKGEMNLAAVRTRAEELRRSMDQLGVALSMVAERVSWADALERFGVLCVQWAQLEPEVRPLLKHYVAHPVSVNQSNAAALPILLASRGLPEAEAADAALLDDLHTRAGTTHLPVDQQLSKVMERGDAMNKAIDGLTQGKGPLDPRGETRMRWQRAVQETAVGRSGTGRQAPPPAGPPGRSPVPEGPELLRAAASYGYGL